MRRKDGNGPYLVSEANAENFLPQGVQLFQQSNEFTDPNVIPVSIIAAARDHVTVVRSEVVVVGELAARHVEHVPRLAFLRQHSHENPKIPSVFLLHVLRILCAEKHRKLFPTHMNNSFTSLRRGLIFSLSKLGF